MTPTALKPNDALTDKATIIKPCKGHVLLTHFENTEIIDFYARNFYFSHRKDLK